MNYKYFSHDKNVAVHTLYRVSDSGVEYQHLGGWRRSVVRPEEVDRLVRERSFYPVSDEYIARMILLGELKL